MLDKFLKFLKQIGKFSMFFSGIGIAGCLLMPALGLANFKNNTMQPAIILALIFFAGLAVSYIAEKAITSRNQRHSKIQTETNQLAWSGKFAEAAELNSRQALKELKSNELFFCLYCRYAADLWVKAREPEKALREARSILEIYVKNNGKWLKTDTGNYFEDLTRIVSNFHAAGYHNEGAKFAGEVNQHLERFNLPMRCAAVPVGKNIFPTSCPTCGAVLPNNPYQDVAQCEYCKAIIYPLNQPKNEYKNPANSDVLHPTFEAANNLVRPENRIVLPPPNPIINGRPQVFYSNTVSFTVPANWKRRDSNYLAADDFFSPDGRFSLSLRSLTVRDKKADMMHELKIIAANPAAKVSLKALNGTVGIFTFFGGNKANFVSNSLNWESFAPPNSASETSLLKISMSYPAEEFERHQQLISDIFGSIKIIK